MWSMQLSLSGQWGFVICFLLVIVIELVRRKTSYGGKAKGRKKKENERVDDFTGREYRDARAMRSRIFDYVYRR